GTPAAPGEPGTPGEPGKPGDPTEILRGGIPEIEFKPQNPYAKVSFNLDDADLPDLVKAISNITGRRFIYGGKLRQIKASVYAPEKVTVAEAYAAFVSILNMNGMTVIPHGRFLKIIESGGVVSRPTPVYGTGAPVPYEDRYITRLYRLSHVDANDVATVLGKFKTKDGDITVYEPSDLLIVTDTGSNLRRMLRIVEELDAGGAGDQIWVQPIHNTPAADVAAQLNELLDLGGGKGGANAKVVPDEKNNALFIVATEQDYHRLLELIKRVDVPDAGEGGIHVLPLQHSQCDELAQTLNQIMGGRGGARPATKTSTATRPTTQRAGGTGGTGTVEEVFEGQVTVTCDEATNSLVTTSSLRDYAQLRSVIDQLDQPRRQVFIEAVIMDLNINHDLDLGVGYHGGATADLGGGGDTIFYGGVNPGQSMTGLPANLEALAFGVRGPDLEGTSDLLGTGISIPGFGVVLHALARSGDSNVLATPHILATDNIPAEISIGQNIPLQTNVGGMGSLAGLASQAGAGGQAGLGALGGLGGLGGLLGGYGFQAPRQDVGITLKVTPHINDSDFIRMELIEEISDAGSPSGALGAVPINKRTANTTVVVRDQQTVVIGGLVRESQIEGKTKVPILGDIPVLGILFRQSLTQTQKTNLLLILTPHIVRDQNDLRKIFERKMQQRQEFLDRYFVFDDTLPWEPPEDYSRTNGLVEHIRQTQLEIEERQRLEKEMEPDAPKTHEPVKPIALPSISTAKSSSTAKPKTSTKKPAPKRTTPRRTNTKTRNIRVPGGAVRSTRSQVE
ncbi:MAG: type II secretion system secretin GspD, partial [Deltaproteobacteria bacterium]|nr:type II secretion system secretin GspD [Deltaproteobacteria bacterium]MBW2534099.1 type II secretion system secretin GspD [Deltaproteobacteria bacterium]